MTDAEKRGIIIHDILFPSLHRLYEIDYDNIRTGVSERNICARLAHHMENIMHEFNNRDLFYNYYVDVEYNRMGSGNLKHYENDQHRPQYMVSDLLIQSRGVSQNLLAVELKRKGNNKNIGKDKERLEAMTSYHPNNPDLQCVYGTLIGAFITYSKDGANVEIYEDRNGHGCKTGELNYNYDSYTSELS